MYKINLSSVYFSWTVCSITVVYCLCLTLAFPSITNTENEQQMSPPVQDISSSTASYGQDIVRRSTTISNARQAGAILAAIGGAIAPFFASLISPILSALATAVSNAILGKLQAGTELNLTAPDPSHYEAYMINVPNQTGPYLLLTNTNSGGDSRRPVAVPSATYPVQSQLDPVNRKPQVQPALKITQHLGTVNVKPYSPYHDRETVPSENSLYSDENNNDVEDS